MTALQSDARAASVAFAALDDPATTLESSPSNPRPEPTPVAKKKAVKTAAANVPGAPDPAVVKQVKDGMMAQLAASPPTGAQAALFDGSGAGKAKLKKVIDALAPVLVKVALSAADGQLSPAEITDLVQDGYGLISKWLAKGGDDGTAPAATSPTPPAPRVA